MNSIDDTFNKLRRVSYIEACVIYTMAGMRNYCSTMEETENAAREDLRIAGWTIEELNKASIEWEKA